MPTLDEFIDSLLVLRAAHGAKKVFYRHGASGDCGELGSAHITDRVDECGPFDLSKRVRSLSAFMLGTKF